MLEQYLCALRRSAALKFAKSVPNATQPGVRSAHVCTAHTRNGVRFDFPFPGAIFIGVRARFYRVCRPLNTPAAVKPERRAVRSQLRDIRVVLFYMRVNRRRHTPIFARGSRVCNMFTLFVRVAARSFHYRAFKNRVRVPALCQRRRERTRFPE